MAKRLINLKQIQEQKIKRGRSWFFEMIAAGDFPPPLDLGLGGANLWDEEAIDRWLDDFIAKAKQRSATGGGKKRVAKALAAREREREQPTS